MAIQAQLYMDNLGFSLGGGGSQDLMENGCGFNQFCFTTQQPIQPHQQILPQKINHNMMHNITESMPFPQFLANQKIEIDHFITLQNERLRLILNEQRKQQVALIWRKYEAKLQFMLKQKDEEIAKAANKTKELEDFLKKMEIEKQAWQRVANEKEAIVISLNNTIEQLKERSTNCEDAESCCDEQEPNRVQQKLCKSCNYRYSCIIFLPCRHLSSCKGCDSLINQCPVCGISKKASIEALI